jgi:multidrug efflux pump subunit AcrB
MSLPGFAVRRWQFTLVVFLALIALGIQSLITIPKTEDPSLALANYAIVAVLPGATPTDLERLVVDPIEARLQTLDDLKRVRTTIDAGLAVLQVEFREGVDVDRKKDSVLREVTALRPSLPPELARLDVESFDPSKVNVREVALVSTDARYHELDGMARALRRRLESVPGVRHVDLAGLPAQEVTVSLDLPRMIAVGISPAEVFAAIGADAQNVPAGSVEQGDRRLDVKTSGDYASAEEVAATVVRTVPGGSSVRVADVATVALGDAETASVARWNGTRAVLVAAAMRDGGNIFDVRKALDAELASFATTLPAGVHLEYGFDQARNVEHRLGGFARDFAIAIGLVLLTLLPLGLRASAIVMVGIPLALAVGLAGLQALGFSINQLSIVGFVIALGLLVDDSIVVVENIARYLRHGMSPRDAAVKATQQITLSVLGCTATLILAFVPLLALPGSAGMFIRSMPVAVVITIAASLLISLTIVPFLSSMLLKPEREEGNVFFRALTRAINLVYRPVLTRAIKRPLLSLGLSFALVAGSVGLVPRIGFGLFPKAGIPQFMVAIDADDGASLFATDRAARFAEGVLARHPEVRNVATVVGKGHPQIYYNVAPRNEKATVADVFAELQGVTGPKAEALLDGLRTELAAWPGARFDVREFENGPPLEAPIALRLLGDDVGQLAEAAATVERVVKAIPGTRDVRNPAADHRSDLRVAIDHDRAALLGVAVPDIDRAVRLAVGGVLVASFHEDGIDEARDVRATLARGLPANVGGGDRPNLAVLDDVYIASTAGAPVPLAAVAQLVLEPSPATVRHYNRQRQVTVTSYVLSGYNTARVTEDAVARLAHEALPPGVRMVVAGEVESRQESFAGMGTAILVAIFGVLAVLVLEFRTFRGTLIVASVLPLGAMGGLFALYLTGYTLSFTATIGFIALMGIEVKNSILLVDHTNYLRRDGLPLEAAIERAGEERFVPVLFTTLTALGGLVPLLLERSSLYSPLAAVLIGGLVSSTLLARVVTPVLYRLLPPKLDEAPEAPRAVGVQTLVPAPAE